MIFGNLLCSHGFILPAENLTDHVTAETISDNPVGRTEKSRTLHPETVFLGYILRSSSRLAGWSNFTKLRTGADT
jgi:hypothetical protein